MSEDTNTPSLNNIKIEDAKYPLNVSGQLLSVAADFVKVMIDHDTQLCTFLLFQKHPTPKDSERGILCTGYQQEVFAEVKVPLSTAFALSEYMHLILEEMKKEGMMKGYSFGPMSVTQKKK